VATEALDRVIKEACHSLPPRALYARAVIEGYQRWSGADLKGKAKKYGAGYAAQRQAARLSLYAAGGCIIPMRHGLLVTAVHITDTVEGFEIYETPLGIAALFPRFCVWQHAAIIKPA
jgi:hypothetical protein